MTEQVEDNDSPQIQGKVGKGRPPIEHRFKKGQSGNPGGKPKGAVSLTSELRKLLKTEIADSKGNKRKAKEAVALAWMQHVLKGNGAYLKEMLARIDGPVTAEGENPGGVTVNINIGERTHDNDQSGDQPETL